MSEQEATSALEEAVRRVGDRWTLLIVQALQAGPRRFNDLSREVPGIAPNVLSQRLKALERDAVVIARPYSKRPPRAAYELTAPGRELAGALALLAQWGARSSETASARRHEACGTPLEARFFCPTCSRVVEGDRSGETRYL
ncbi:MAG: helix-turn-helix transcriptional regulator [Actinomycetota bacterium]|nr:helix-turn-helix transcriptional regulator [Actinomycetota bacterium]